MIDSSKEDFSQFAKFGFLSKRGQANKNASLRVRAISSETQLHKHTNCDSKQKLIIASEHPVLL